jgi:hypothetical protein
MRSSSRELPTACTPFTPSTPGGFDPDLHSLFNVNRPEDAALARKLIEARSAAPEAGLAGERADEG